MLTMASTSLQVIKCLKGGIVRFMYLF